MLLVLNAQIRTSKTQNSEAANLVEELGVAIHGADVLPQLGKALLGVVSPLLPLLDGAEV